jgi:pyruvate kinase
MEIWISLSKKNFGEAESIDRIDRRIVAGYRINLARESLAFTEETTRYLLDLGVPPPRIFYDIGNTKARIANIRGLPRNELFAGCKVLISNQQVESSRHVGKEVAIIEVSPPLGSLSEDDQLVLGDGDYGLRVVEVNLYGFLAKYRGDRSGLEIGTSISILNRDPERVDLSLEEIDVVRDLVGSYGCSLMYSFVRDGKDIPSLRSTVGFPCAVYAKIETIEALSKLEEILRAADGCVVARGDLGLAVGLVNMGVVQEQIIIKAKELKRPIVIAGEILASSSYRDTPLRAEISDITRLAQSGVTAFLLTSETASSPRPYGVISYLGKIIEALKV